MRAAFQTPFRTHFCVALATAAMLVIACCLVFPTSQAHAEGITLVTQDSIQQFEMEALESVYLQAEQELLEAQALVD